MLSFEQARATILQNVTALGTEKVPLLEAVGRVLAADVKAPWDLPGSDNSAMDGFAVRSEDAAAGARLAVTDYIPAGASSQTAVACGCAARIMTGAPLPPQADAVIPLEETDEHDGVITVGKEVLAGSHVRAKGEDVAEGNTVITAGTLIGPAQVSMLASCAQALVTVYRRARVAILTTGDELVEIGTTPGQGEIINSNALAVAAAVKLCGADPVLIGTARDTRESHLELIREGLKADLLITSAGVSAGDRDLVRETLAELGVKELFWKVLMRPGSPTAFGLKDTTPVLSLPGNPVATMITFEELVRPALRKMMGHARVQRRSVPGVLRDGAHKKPGNLHFLRVNVSLEGGRYLASTSGDQKTGFLSTMLAANALALLPAERTTFAPGEEVELHILDDSLQLEE